MPTPHITFSYKLAELGDEAKERARNHVRNGICLDPPWREETHASYNAARELIEGAKGSAMCEEECYGFPATPDYQCEACIRNSTPEGRAALWEAHVTRGCSLTGYCADDEALDVVRDHLLGGGSWEDAESVLDSAKSESQERDLDHQCEVEQVDDFIEANGYVWTENGDVFSPPKESEPATMTAYFKDGPVDVPCRRRGNPQPRLTRDGYTVRGGSPMTLEVLIHGRWRRVYCVQFSNNGTCFVKGPKGKGMLCSVS